MRTATMADLRVSLGRTAATNGGLGTSELVEVAKAWCILNRTDLASLTIPAQRALQAASTGGDPVAALKASLARSTNASLFLRSGGLTVGVIKAGMEQQDPEDLVKFLNMLLQLIAETLAAR